MTDFMSFTGTFRFYFGASYGSAQTALRRTEEPHVMISYATANNRPWDGIENLFIDCGAFSLFTHHSKNGYETGVDEYLEYVDRVGAEKYALRDIPCDQKTVDATELSVADHQDITVEMHQECLAMHNRMGLDARPVTAIQGRTPEDYVEHIHDHARAGTLMYDVGVGSLAGRPLEEIEDILIAVDNELDDHVEIHGYGITPRALHSQTVRMILDTADSSKWSYGQYSDRIHLDERMFHVLLKKYLDTKRELFALFAGEDAEVVGHDETEVDLELSTEILDGATT